MKTIPVKFDEKDGMPVEVATEILAKPFAARTATMRRECWRARQRTITSPTPIVRDVDSAGYHTNPEQVRAPLEKRLAKRMAKHGMARLIQLQRSTFKRRMEVQRIFSKAEEQLARMKAETEHAQIIRNAALYSKTAALLNHLNSVANQLDAAMDAIDDAIGKRTC